MRNHVFYRNILVKYLNYLPCLKIYINYRGFCIGDYVTGAKIVDRTHDEMIKRMENHIDEWKSSVTSAELDAYSHMIEFESLKNEKTRLEDELSEKTISNEVLEKKYCELKEDVDDLKKQHKTELDNATRDLDDLKNKLQHFVQQVEKRVKHNHQPEQRRQQLEQRNQQLKQLNQQLEQRNQQLEKRSEWAILAFVGCLFCIFIAFWHKTS